MPRQSCIIRYCAHPYVIVSILSFYGLSDTNCNSGSFYLNIYIHDVSLFFVVFFLLLSRFCSNMFGLQYNIGNDQLRIKVVRPKNT